MSGIQTSFDSDWLKWSSHVTSVLEDIRGERQYQLERWGVQCHDIATWLAIIGEEQGEVCKAFLDNQRSNNHTDRLRMRKHLRKEAVQLAASAAAFVQFLDDGEA